MKCRFFDSLRRTSVAHDDTVRRNRRSFDALHFAQLAQDDSRLWLGEGSLSPTLSAKGTENGEATGLFL